MLNTKWFVDFTTENEGSLHSLVEVMYSKQTRFQLLEILKLGSYGKCLVLDSKVQSAQSDEFIYHESLVHPSLISMDSPGSVLIAGGGEGATIREVLRHKTIKEVVLVDIDPDVVHACKLYLPEWHRGAFDDPRVKVIFDDARSFIENSDTKYDLIILDLPEPFEGGPAPLLYTTEFYQTVSDHLTDHGAMVTHATSTAVHNCACFLIIANTIKNVFPIFRPYTVNVPSFYSPWGFVFASRNSDPLGLLFSEMKNRIENLKDLHFYDEEVHGALFALPKSVKEALKKEERINKDSAPISFYGTR